MRYFFHFASKDDLVADAEGVDLPDLRAAHRHALRLIHQTGPSFQTGRFGTGGGSRSRVNAAKKG
jgi:hypothetical protein